MKKNTDEVNASGKIKDGADLLMKSFSFEILFSTFLVSFRPFAAGRLATNVTSLISCSHLNAVPKKLNWNRFTHLREALNVQRFP